ncbi:D-hydantoinase [Aspergillus steynii IBT 23096]|uniref:dihydropyrimidinase n=1 Tax=Aspergillus steynii IBT 23096 TaxID=1392250 RepID=A0A2I2FUC7_9EURO|nr:D-hydantoinase [Aspergillus steynii IBT 23096]PLB44211.1 D-hydantoinase [Aspergillus steynii IBT 23096]
MLDMIIRNGRIVTAAEVLPFGTEIGVRDGKIATLGLNLEVGDATEVIDAEGAYITPGGVDSHVHIAQDNAPTGDTWETGTRSAIAGGNTTVIAFATQKRTEESLWPALEAYHKKATGNAFCDYGFHLIVTNPNESVLNEELPALVDRGITSIKLYMTYQPLRLGDGDLFNLMMRARRLGITTMIHCENNDIIEQITKRLAEQGNLDSYFHSVARPQIAESEATYRAISLAEITDTPILIVHMSAPEAVRHVNEAQRRLLPIHAETCPHYLYLISEHLMSGPDDFDGARNICAPPLRHDAKDLEYLWRGLANGTFTVVSSDHAPSAFDHPCGKMRGLSTADGDGKPRRDFRNVPNGVPGVETRLPLLFNRTVGHKSHGNGDSSIHISLPRFVQLTSTNPAKLYGLGDRKGSLLPGYDADIVIWYPEEGYNAPGLPVRFTITNESLHHRIDFTPFEGIKVRNWPRWVFLRGKLAWDRDGEGVVGRKGEGQFLKRQPSTTLTGQAGQTAMVQGSSTQQVNILLINPNSTESMTESCLRSIESTLPPHVSVYGFTCPKTGPSAIEGNVDATISAADSFRALASLLRKLTTPKIDAFLVACFSAHPLIGMLREEYPQPAIGIMEAALYASRMCGDQLGIVTTSERSSMRHSRATFDLGLGNNFVGCETGNASVLELESAPKGFVHAGLATAARKLVDRGADCVCLGCAGMTGLHEACRQAVLMDDGQVMVVDGVAVGVHFLLGLVRVGLRTTKSGVYRPAFPARERRGQDWL